MKIFGLTFGNNNDKLVEIVENNALTLSENQENELGFFKSIYDSTSNWTSNTAENISQTFNSTKEKASEAYNNSINFISETSSEISDSTKQNFVSVKEKIGNTYYQFEIKNNLYVILDLISIPLIITELKKLSLTVPAPQLRIGIVIIIGLLMILENHKINKQNKILSNKEINEKTNFDVSNLLKDVDLKSIILLIEPFEKQIPKGKQVLFLVKLFIK